MIKSILIVDDDKEDVEIFCDAIKEIDTDVICNSVSNGREALKLLLTDGYKLPDCIFMDINMPQLNGKQCLRQLKLNSCLKHIPVVMCSTSKLEADIVECEKLGAARFFTKPTSFKIFKEELELFLK